jgi:predicted kinase
MTFQQQVVLSPFEADEHHLIAIAVLGLLGKIVWDWLAKRRNGHSDAKMDLMYQLLMDMDDRQKKIWDTVNRELNRE